MKDRFMLSFASVLMFLAVFLISQAAWALEDRTFPQVPIQAPEEDVYQDYLGVKGKDSFMITDVKSDLVLVQLFSMYCPICQREAGDVNELYRMIHEEGLDDSIKILALAPGNSAFEVSVFREQYDVPFPMFPDADFEWHKRLGEVGTPTFYAVSTRDGRVLGTHTGPFREGVEAYLKSVKELL